ncbi:MAG: aspartate carbamoyltransferase [Clostridia bacterium]|nr:aspartate carbamoyltransferase [Clostridia bacterium]
MKNLVDILDLTKEEIDDLVARADDIYRHPAMYSDACHGKILATLFFEPSTRTRLSFASAMMSLGGSVLGFEQAGSTSVTKGETVADTIRMVAAYSDIIAMRHPYEGAPIVASSVSKVPVINAGDGGHFHPTQTLTDLFSIREKLGRFDHLTVGLCGDLKYGRTVHSLISAMSRYEGTKFVLISPKELKLPDYVKEEFLKDADYVECESLEDAIPELDILYMTRIQGERFADRDEYERLKDSYILNAAKLKDAKPTLSIMHPLPRVNEIDVDVDTDPRAHYFDQAEGGRYIRMALILKLLDDGVGLDSRLRGEENPELRCSNPHCISRTERGIKKLFVGDRCSYCDQAASAK